MNMPVIQLKLQDGLYCVLGNTSWISEWYRFCQQLYGVTPRDPLQIALSAYHRFLNLPRILPLIDAHYRTAIYFTDNRGIRKYCTQSELPKLPI